MGWMPEESSSDYWVGTRDFFLITASRPPMRLTHPPIQWVSGDVSPGVKRQKRQADNLSTCSDKVNNGGPGLSEDTNDNLHRGTEENDKETLYDTRHYIIIFLFDL
jgi:hypothetical protein